MVASPCAAPTSGSSRTDAAFVRRVDLSRAAVASARVLFMNDSWWMPHLELGTRLGGWLCRIAHEPP